jgi:hypothetical protein
VQRYLFLLFLEKKAGHFSRGGLPETIKLKNTRLFFKDYRVCVHSTRWLNKRNTGAEKGLSLQG